MLNRKIQISRPLENDNTKEITPTKANFKYN